MLSKTHASRCAPEIEEGGLDAVEQRLEPLDRVRLGEVRVRVRQRRHQVLDLARRPGEVDPRFPRSRPPSSRREARCGARRPPSVSPRSSAPQRNGVTVRWETGPANGSSNRRTRFAVNRRSSRSHSSICFRQGARLLTRCGDTRTGGVGRPMARRTVLTSNFNRRAISFFGTPSTRCRWRTSAH